MKLYITLLLTPIILLFLLIAVVFFGWHYETASGEHTGYITAVQTKGLFYKTHSVYLKTDTQSTQEDQYCVVDDEVFTQLQALQESKTKVTVKFIEWFSDGAKYCSTSDRAGVIVGIK